MENPYTPVDCSTANSLSDRFVSPRSEDIGLKYAGSQASSPRFIVENSQNPYAWVEGEGEDAFVDLSDRR